MKTNVKERPLTAKQESAAQHYTSDSLNNLTDAMRKAGYSESYATGRGTGDLLGDVRFQARVAELMESEGNFITRSRQRALDKLWEALDTVDTRNIDQVCKITDQLAKYEGWHAAVKHADVSDYEQLQSTLQARVFQHEIDELNRKLEERDKLIRSLTKGETTTRDEVLTSPPTDIYNNEDVG